MSGRPHIEIKESRETLQAMLKEQKRVLEHDKVLALYFLKSGQAVTAREVAKLLGKGEATIHRWLHQYREGGIENLLENKQVYGRPKKLEVETVAKLRQELADPEGFASYKEVNLWLRIIEGIEVSYWTVYKLVKYELKSHLKVPRPISTKQKQGAINEFKGTLGEQIKNLLEKESEKREKYSRVSYWCYDETRMGLHTVQRRKLTLFGVKPQGEQQWQFDSLWLYGAIEPQGGRSHFFEFSHLDKTCFSQYLELLSQAYPEELMIVQVDNSAAHNLSEAEIPQNIILLFQPPYCPEVNPIERVWEYIKEFLAWRVYFNLDGLRLDLKKILSSLSQDVIGLLTGWSWILYSLCLS